MDIEIRQKMAVEPTDVEGQFAAILADAARSYKEKSGGSLDDFMTPPMASVDDLQRQLNIHNDGFAAFRAKRQAVFGAVASALRPVELVGDIAAGAASHAFAPSQTIYAAVLFLISAGHNVSATYDSIVELFEQLSDFTSRLDVYVRYPLSSSLRNKVVSILVALFDVIVLATKEIRRGRVRAYLKRIIGSSSPVQPALDRLKALTLGEERQVMADTFGNVSELGTKAGRIESIVTQVNQGVQILQVEHRELANRPKDEKLRAILNPSPFPDDIYCALKKSIVPHTGAWILSDEGLTSWLRAEVPYLWIFGNAGTGKSFVITSVISWALENADKIPFIGYFYFRADNPETRSVLQALRDVAHQLSEKDIVYRRELVSKLESRDEIKTVASAFRKLFAPPAGRHQTSRIKYIFLDGIDEADPDEIRELLSCLSPDDGEVLPPAHFQFALIGRPYLSDNVALKLDPNGRSLATLQVTSDRNASDVRAFINSSVLHSRVLSRTSVDFKAKVIAALEQQADGFFIVAKFMLDDVNRKRHQSSILESLQAYPKEINSVLQRTLTDLSNTITEEEARDLREILCWVTCAEEPLTLGQLEAALVLRFGDPPMFLEESLRRQYSCFFDLEREDGLTTDDLVKDAGRVQRELRRDLGPSRLFSLHPGRSFSAGEASMPKRRLSPAAPNRNSMGGLSNPIVDYAPSRLSGSSFDVASDTEFRSSKSTTRVTFFHSSVRDFFRASHLPAKSNSASLSFGFDVDEARLRIVKTCFKIFIDKDWFMTLDLGPGKEALRQYAAWYWQEHIASIDPVAVPRQEKRQLAGQLYRMLTEESTVYDWSIMYEKNDEGLEVLNDANIRGLRRWFRDADVVDGLDAKAAAFARASTARAAGVCEHIGRYYARAWLADDFEGYVPPLFCFKIVQSVAFMEAGYDWAHSSMHTVEERMAQATSWAAQKETAHWHRRVGNTYLMMGFTDEALRHYDAALERDKNNIETRSRIAYCLYKDGKYHDALDQSAECAAMEERDIRDGRLSQAELGHSRWRLYRDYLVIAKCAHETGDEERTHIFFAKAMAAAGDAGLSLSESLEAEAGYLEALAAENQHRQMVALATDMAAQTSRNDHGQGRFADLLLEHHDTDLVLDWMPKAACKAGQLDFLLEQAGHALEVADSMSDSTRALYLRLALGTAYAYNGEADEAMAVFEHISLLEARPRGNIATRRAHAASFQKLAGLYKHKALQAGLKTVEGEVWVRKLEAVQSKQREHRNADMPPVMLGSDINAASVYLASFYRLQGRKDESDALLRGLIGDSLAILSDSEPQNDVFALDNLLRIFIAADDVDNAQALARSMRKVNPEASISTYGDSPVERRNATAPKLPGIRPHDRSCFQCLDTVAASAEFVMCQLCMESYCRRCRDDGVGDGEARGVERVTCHEWFTVKPLNKVLHTGEIQLKDDSVQGFTEWKEGIRRHWKCV